MSSPNKYSRNQLRQILVESANNQKSAESKFWKQEGMVDGRQEMSIVDQILHRLEKCTSKKINVDELSDAMEDVARRNCKNIGRSQMNLLSLQVMKAKETIPRSRLRGALDQNIDFLKNSLIPESYNPLISIIMGQLEGLRTNRIQVSEFKGTFEKIAAIVQVDEDEV